jgi:sec-independent protein translocase protein TatA
VRFGMWEILLIALVILLLFGATRIPDLMRGLAKGIRGFKDEMKAEDKPEGAGEKPKTN